MLDTVIDLSHSNMLTDDAFHLALLAIFGALVVGLITLLLKK